MPGVVRGKALRVGGVARMYRANREWVRHDGLHDLRITLRSICSSVPCTFEACIAVHERSALSAALSGRYEIDREIGRGGMATVYLPRDLPRDTVW